MLELISDLTTLLSKTFNYNNIIIADALSILFEQATYSVSEQVGTIMVCAVAPDVLPESVTVVVQANGGSAQGNTNDKRIICSWFRNLSYIHCDTNVLYVLYYHHSW